MAYTDSNVVTTSITLPGVLIHDPASPQSTIISYPYGENTRDTAIDVEQSGTQYAGRTFPVIDYGESETQVENVRLIVPSGPDYQTQLESLIRWQRLKRAVQYRDNRGRAVRGTMSGLKIADQAYGADVQFTLTRVNVSGETVD
jgi:hypothetical protein